MTLTLESPPCYCRGTLIATERGEVAVEDLRIGDRVRTLSGALRPLKWIGTRAYSARFAGNNPDLLPIRFTAGSLADGLPARDLLVSPEHAMFLDGVLISAKHLVNGATVVREKPEDDIHYFHIELESHDVLIAEGAFSESFVDDNSRGMFQNAHEFKKLYPDERPNEVVYCAPRVEDGFTLERVRRRIAERAGLPYPAETDFGLLLGEVEHCDHEGVSGWARNAAFPDTPVCLDVLVDGAFAGYAYAEAERPHGGRGFALRFAPALDPSRPHEIELRRSADGAALDIGPFHAAATEAAA
ncbi:Hint domain-containing protein [Rhodoblastus sp.]|uniref:Hint domain-containing protein n=1 Tax=Rhodoblastus sp. TaxID=1962975 RepID=UPI003F96B38F